MTFLSLDSLVLQIWILKKSDLQDLDKDYKIYYFWILYVPGYEIDIQEVFFSSACPKQSVGSVMIPSS